MKYTDRKHAKRKYKQMVLTTVAAMTLGVSTLGSTASVFAAENTQPIIDTSKIEKPDIVNFTKYKEVVEKNAGNSGVKLGGAVFTEWISGNPTAPDWNKLAKVFTTSAIELFPGGMFISPIINLIWTTNDGNGALIEQITKKLTAIMDEKIETEHLSSMKDDFKALSKSLITVQNLVNNDSSFKLPEIENFAANESSIDTAEYSSLTPAGGQAQIVEHAFQNLLTHLSNQNHAVSDLILYTNVANIHLQFLDYMKKYGTSATFRYTANELQTIYKVNDIKKIADSYTTHIQATYKDAIFKLNDKIQKLGGSEGEINNKIEEIKHKSRSANGDVAMMQERERNKEIADLKANIPDVQKIETSKKDLAELTIKNSGFDTIVTSIMGSNPLIDLIIPDGDGWVKNSKNIYYRGYKGDKTDVANGTLATKIVLTNKQTQKEYVFDAEGIGHELDYDATHVKHKGTGWYVTKSGKYFYISQAKDGANHLDNGEFAADITTQLHYGPKSGPLATEKYNLNYTFDKTGVLIKHT